MKWETDLVLNGKLDPKMAHKHVYDHPVVTQRDQILCEFLRKNQNKVLLDYLISYTYCTALIFTFYLFKYDILHLILY